MKRPYIFTQKYTARQPKCDVCLNYMLNNAKDKLLRIFEHFASLGEVTNAEIEGDHLTLTIGGYEFFIGVVDKELPTKNQRWYSLSFMEPVTSGARIAPEEMAGVDYGSYANIYALAEKMIHLIMHYELRKVCEQLDPNDEDQGIFRIHRN